MFGQLITLVQTFLNQNKERLHYGVMPSKDADGIANFKNTDQTPPKHADQRLCSHYIDSTIPLLPKSKI